MAHPKIDSNTITFTDQYAEELGLSKAQVKVIDELTYDFMKNYQFNVDPNYNEQIEREKYDRAILEILDKPQQSFYAQLKDKQENYCDSSFEERKLQSLKKKYEALKFSENKLIDFGNIVDEVRRKAWSWSPKTKRSKNLKNKHEFFLKLLSERMKDFLSKKQLEIFIKIENDEQNYLKGFHSNRIMEINPSLYLTKKQAEKIYDYEENAFDLDENGEFEKWDMELMYMSAILDNSQYISYSKQIQEQRNHHISFLKESNESKVATINELKSRYSYVVEYYLPVLCDWRVEIDKNIPKSLNQFIQTWRSNYYENLEILLQESLERTKRYHLNYFPNERIELKLRTKARALIPAPYSLSDFQMDFLDKIPKELKEQLATPSEKLEYATLKLNEFDISNYEAHGGNYSGSTYVIRNNSGEDNDLRLFSNLLIHPNIGENIKASEKFI
ncbi:MAG: hypothetical protein AAGC45_10300 [Bacteroidota bacterium]